MTEINITGLALNFTQPGMTPPKEITTDVLLEVCKQMDDQVYMAAIGGMILSILAIVYFGRVRRKLQKDHPESIAIPFLDKFLLTMIAMCFVIIIVRLLRAG